MIRRIYWLALKDLLESLRSQTALVVLLSPLLLAMIFRSLLGSEDVKPIPVAVVGPADCGLTRVLEQHPGLAILRRTNTLEALPLLHRGRAVLVLEIEPEFDSKLRSGPSPSLKLWSDRGKPTQVALAREYLRGSLRQQAGQTLPARIVSQNVGKSSSQDFWFASTVLLASMAAMVLAAANVIEEKEAGTLQQILLSPASPNEVWVGKLAVSTALGTISAMLVVVLHGATTSGFCVALGLTSVASFVFAALGGIIGLLANGPAAASSWTGLCFIAFFAPASLSETSLALSRWAHVSPAYYLYEGIQRSVLAQESAASQAANFGVLLALGVILTFVGGHLLRRCR